MRRLAIMTVLTLAVILATPALAQQDQPPAKKPVHVITEDDLSKPADASNTAAATTDQEQDQDKDKDAAKDPDDKRSDVQKSEDEVKKWKKEEDTLNRKLERVQEQAQSEQSDFRRQMFQDAYNNQQATLQDLRQKREAAEKSLATAKEKEKEQGGAEAPQGSQEQPPQEQPPQ